MTELKVKMDQLLERLVEMVKGTGIIEFSSLIKGMDRMNAIRTFITLLFLAQDGSVSLWQDEESEEIYIAVGNLKGANERVR
jgi:chromatin segregation and condensation protein Rec8/ScpA/Scc1 (kleisin family)